MKKRRHHGLVFLAVSLILTSLACNMSAITAASSADAAATATMQALADLVAQTLEPGGSGQGVEAEESKPTEPEAPAPNPTTTPTPTTSPTPPPSAPMVSVSVDTNCRFGPGDVYDYLGALLIGETSEVAGKNNSETFWYIRNPNPPPEFCWIWGYYAEVEGDTDTLPILTPPPTPTPEVTPTPTPTPNVAISAYLKYVGNVGNIWKLTFRIANEGDVPLESFKLTVQDLQTSDMRVKVSDSFGIGPSMNPGEDDYPRVEFNYNVSHHDMTAVVKMCTEDGLSGICAQTSFNFAP